LGGELHPRYPLILLVKLMHMITIKFVVYRWIDHVIVKSDLTLGGFKRCIRIIYINPVRTSQETHYFSATEPNRLMPFRETVAVYCEKHTEHRYSPYLIGNIRLRYRAQPVNAVWGTQSLFTVRTIRNTQIQSVPHRKHITSSLQIPTG
jgi:hypothetical protein